MYARCTVPNLNSTQVNSTQLNSQINVRINLAIINYFCICNTSIPGQNRKICSFLLTNQKTNIFTWSRKSPIFIPKLLHCALALLKFGTLSKPRPSHASDTSDDTTETTRMDDLMMGSTVARSFSWMACGSRRRM